MIILSKAQNYEFYTQSTKRRLKRLHGEHNILVKMILNTKYKSLILIVISIDCMAKSFSKSKVASTNRVHEKEHCGMIGILRFGNK